VRAKNVANQLTKNLLTWGVGIIVYFLVGFGIEGIVGGGGVSVDALTSALTASDAGWVDWLFGAVFAMTAATIVSGAVAGRAKLVRTSRTSLRFRRSSTRSSRGSLGAAGSSRDSVH